MFSELASEYNNFDALLNGDNVVLETFLKNTKNKTYALTLLVGKNRPELIPLLEIDINTICYTFELTCLWNVNTIETLQSLVKQNIDVHHRDIAGQSIMYYLVDNFDLFALQFECMFEYMCSFKIEKNWNELIIHIIHKNAYGRLYALLRIIARRSDFSIKEIDNIVVDDNFDVSSFCWLTLLGRNWNVTFKDQYDHLEDTSMTICLLECLGKIIDDDISSIVSNKFDDSIKNKLLIQNDNVVKFERYGTNFFTLPYCQIIDALTMLLYTGYKETHPLYEKYNYMNGFAYCNNGARDSVNMESIVMYVDKIKAKLKAVFILSNYSQIAKEIAQNDFEEAQESISKRIKKT